MIAICLGFLQKEEKKSISIFTKLVSEQENEDETHLDSSLPGSVSLRWNIAIWSHCVCPEYWQSFHRMLVSSKALEKKSQLA